MDEINETPRGWPPQKAPVMTLRLHNDPSIAFQPLYGPPKSCEHPLHFAYPIKQLQHKGTDILLQVIPGLSFSAELYTIQLKGADQLRITVHEPIVVFAYLLKLKHPIQLLSETGEKITLNSGFYGPVQLPKGTYTSNGDAGLFNLFYFSLPFGYLIHFQQFYPCLEDISEPLKRYPKKLIIHPFFPISYPVKKLFAEWKNCPKRKGELEGAMMMFWGKFLKLYQEQASKQRVTVDAVAILPDVYAYLETHFLEQGVDYIPALATRFDLSETSLRRGFKKHYQTTIHTLVDNLRMDFAKIQLLKGTSIKEVAEQLHYNSEYNFSRDFYLHFKIRPSDL